ncbi:MAG: PilZ domain-containing protein [Pseudomonadota bacterium]
MKLAGKVDSQNDVKAHLQELSDFQVPVRLFSKEGVFLSKGSFSFEVENGGSLSFTPIPPNWSQCTTVACHYSHQISACTFQTRLLRVENSKLYLDRPPAILFFDRRKYFRIKPSKAQPVLIRFAVPGKAGMRLPARDISGGGFSVLMPSRMDFFSIGMTLLLRVELPGEETIECRVTVKSIFSFLNITRIGCEFGDISEKVRSTVMSYCVRRELEMRNAPDIRENDSKNLNVCIVDEASGKKPYSFLEVFFSITMVEPLNAIHYLKQKPPDLMVINAENAGARLILQAISRDPLLKELPLILICKKSTRTNSRSGAGIVITSPYKKKYLLKSMKEFVEKIRLSKEIGQSCWPYFTGDGKRIVIVDPQGNLSPFTFQGLEKIEFKLHWVRAEEGIIGRIEAARPDVLLLDSETGGMDPGTLCRLMNLNKVLKNIPKIRLISGGDAPQSKLFENAGISFLSKPIGTERLFEVVNKALGREM